MIVTSDTRVTSPPAPTGAVKPKLIAAAKLPVTWEMSFLNAAVFGGFVAFRNYLPTWLDPFVEPDLCLAHLATPAAS